MNGDDTKDMAAELKAESIKRYGVPAGQMESELTRMMARVETESDPHRNRCPRRAQKE